MPRMTNPDFLPPPEGLHARWQRMAQQPVGLSRPLVVVAGWRAPAWPSKSLARHLAGLAGERQARFTAIAFTTCFSFDAAVSRVAAAVDRLWPSNSSTETTAVDMVGISMGGLIARACAIAPARGKRVQIARLFTLGTPHRGARAAPFIPLEPLVRAMRPGSAFLGRLDEHLPSSTYQMRCYARLRDSWVGASNTAPHGSHPFWTPGPFLLSHQTISADRLIRTDIALHLRNEPGLATAATPPPRD